MRPSPSMSSTVSPSMSSSSCGYGRVLGADPLRLVRQRPFGAVGIDARADVERAGIERARHVGVMAVLRRPACAGSRGCAADAATSVAWMLPSTQNAGLSAAGPVVGVGHRHHPDVAALVALADRLPSRRDADDSRDQRVEQFGEFGVAVEWSKTRAGMRGSFWNAVELREARQFTGGISGSRQVRLDYRINIRYHWRCSPIPGPHASPYAELHCLSNFSFLRGASHPEELAERAHALGYAALGADRRMLRWPAWCARISPPGTAGCTFIVGSEFTLADGLKLVLYATDRAKLRRPRATDHARPAQRGQGQLRADRATMSSSWRRVVPRVWIPPRQRVTTPIDRRCALVRRRLRRPRLDRARNCSRAPAIARASHAAGAGAATGLLPLVAAGDVHMHARARRALQDHAHRRSACARRSPSAVTRSSPTASGTCARARGWPRSIRAS